MAVEDGRALEEEGGRDGGFGAEIGAKFCDELVDMVKDGGTGGGGGIPLDGLE